MTVLLSIALIVFFILWLNNKANSKKEYNNLSEVLEDQREKARNLKARNEVLEIRITELIKYEGILDVEKEAQQIKLSAELISNDARRMLQKSLLLQRIKQLK